ncbi:hypothetical protein SVIOM342S_03294 [Streptomyces violaceorubidus]
MTQGDPPPQRIENGRQGGQFGGEITRTRPPPRRRAGAVPNLREPATDARETWDAGLRTSSEGRRSADHGANPAPGGPGPARRIRSPRTAQARDVRAQECPRPLQRTLRGARAGGMPRQSRPIEAVARCRGASRSSLRTSRAFVHRRLRSRPRSRTSGRPSVDAGPQSGFHDDLEHRPAPSARGTFPATCRAPRPQIASRFGRPDGAWWPRTRDLARELGELADVIDPLRAGRLHARGRQSPPLAARPARCRRRQWSRGGRRPFRRGAQSAQDSAGVLHLGPLGSPSWCRP